jgi:hypothetical protein
MPAPQVGGFERFGQRRPDGFETLVAGAVYFGHAPDANLPGQTIYFGDEIP